MDAATLAQYLVPLLAFAAGYGSINTRVKTLEQVVAQTVTRVEFNVLKERLDEMVSEIKGLRHDITDIMRRQV